MRAFINVLRWMAVLPAYALAGTVLYLLMRLSWGYVMDTTFIDEMNEDPGFAGHHFLGPIFLWTLFMGTGAVSVMAGTWVAPKHKNIVKWILAVIGVLLGIFMFGAIVYHIGRLRGEGYSFNTEAVIKSALEAAAFIIGSIVGRTLSMEDDNDEPILGYRPDKQITMPLD